jgi:hypothetical protein
MAHVDKLLQTITSIRMNNQLTEAEVRALRDRVYGKPISDNEWATARPHWMSPDGIMFLRAHDFPISESLQRKAQNQQAQPKPC